MNDPRSHLEVEQVYEKLSFLDHNVNAHHLRMLPSAGLFDTRRIDQHFSRTDLACVG